MSTQIHIACATLAALLSHIVAPNLDAQPAASAAPGAEQPAEQLDAHAKLIADIDRQAQSLIDDQIVVGMVVGLVQPGADPVFRGYGRISDKTDQAPDADTVFEIGSITKVFTGILLADALTRGQVKLDDPVQQHLPGDAKLPQPHGQPIRLIHLATHTSGLPRMPANFAPADPANPYADYTPRQLIAFVTTHKPAAAPGQKHAYSNLAMGLLGHVLAEQADQPWESLIRSRICKPLKMPDTRMTLTPAMQQRLAQPHQADLSPAANWDIQTLSGAGALRSTARDMMTFAQANLAPPDDQLGQALKLAQRPHHPLPPGRGSSAMGLGWFVAGDRITRWHNGMTGGYHSFLAVVPSRGVACIVLANTATMRVTHFGETVIRRQFGIPFPKPQNDAKTVKVPREQLDRYVGVYAMDASPAMRFTVTRRGDRLFVKLTGQSAFQVFPKSPTEFFYKVVQASITFQPDAQGPCKKLTLHQNGLTIPATRSDPPE